MSNNSQVSVKLPERLDRSAAIELKAQLDECLGQTVEIDASENQSISGAGLQVLCVAESHWNASGWEFEILQPSEKLSEILSWIGRSQHNEFGENVECL